jgi:hypothetical protein
MNTKLIIVADLGLLRAYREVRGSRDRKPRLELIEELAPEAAHEKLSEQVTDQAGRFPRGSGPGNLPGDLSAGERLNLETEQNRRLLARLAEKINGLLADRNVTECFLAASAPIHKQLLEAIDPAVRDKIDRVLASNLARTDPQELPEHFATAS